MSTRAELEAQLRKLEVKESNDRLQSELENYIKNYEGCTASHKICRFKHPGKGYDFHAERLSNFRIKGDTIIYDSEGINIRQYNSFFEFKIESNEYPRDVSSLRYRILGKHVIEESRFYEIMNECKSFLELGMEPIRLTQPVNNETESIGDHISEKNKVNLIEESGFDLLDLTTIQDGIKHTSLIEILSWNNHPLLVGNYIVKSKESIKMVELIISKINNESMHSGSRTREANNERVSRLKTLLKYMMS